MVIGGAGGRSGATWAADALGQAFVQRPLAFQIGPQGSVLWFIVISWLAVIGSLSPAWRAARTCVREVLACE